METLLSFVMVVLVFAVVGGLLWFIIQKLEAAIPLPGPTWVIIECLFIIILVLVLLNIFLGNVAFPMWRGWRS